LLLAAAPDPASAAALDAEQITAALTTAGRRHIPGKVTWIQAALRTEQLTQPGVVTGAYAATVRAQVAILTVLNTQIEAMAGQLKHHFGQHPAPAPTTTSNAPAASDTRPATRRA
jgi:hypothetical protein